MEDADVCLFQVIAYDDAYTYMIEDAQDAGKPFIVLIQSPNSFGEHTISVGDMSAALTVE